jgi:hypothetical protein
MYFERKILEDVMASSYASFLGGNGVGRPGRGNQVAGIITGIDADCLTSEAEGCLQFNPAIGRGARERATREAIRLAEKRRTQVSHRSCQVHPVEYVAGVDAERQAVAATAGRALIESSTTAAPKSTATASARPATDGAARTTTAGWRSANALPFRAEAKSFRKA